MPDSDRGTEPNGWELLRAVKALDSRFDVMAQNSVSAPLFATLVERVAATERELDQAIRDRDAKIEREKTERVAEVAQLRAAADQAQKSRAQIWVSLGVLALGAIITFALNAFGSALGVP